MRAAILPAFAFILGVGFLSAPEAQARFNAAQLQAPSLVEDVACVTRRIRTVRPNGRVVYRTVRRCGVRPAPRWRDRCRTIRERVIRPNGTVIYRNIRRCR
ncbi:hypothetical protein [Microvirga lenta]|uniref:hypothetical protein n=1 Tax=Microvirga lenta TaxID=2881337 RepID=UPI001CFFD099|nr:hypothetical protein [Microvirga lenta]MCB5175049.1 hypothetical protein [Microvirga lenta]